MESASISAMPISRTRPMAAVYLFQDDQILLMHRRGSKVVENLWVGVGGRLTGDEAMQPIVGLLREVREEIGLAPSALHDLHMRYITVRRVGDEIRMNYYFFARIPCGVNLAPSCREGTLRWFPATISILGLPMPSTSRAALADHFSRPTWDGLLRAVICTGVAEIVSIVGPGSQPYA